MNCSGWLAGQRARQSNPIQELLADPVCMELTYAAIRIDPCINLRLIEDCGTGGTNVFPDHHWGHDYVTACSLVGAGTFSDIVLLPRLNACEEERFIPDVLHSLAEESESFRCLIISGEAAVAHEWVGRLPPVRYFWMYSTSFPALMTMRGSSWFCVWCWRSVKNSPEFTFKTVALFADGTADSRLAWMALTPFITVPAIQESGEMGRG